MNVFVIGSMRPENDADEGEGQMGEQIRLFRSACQELGMALGSAGHSTILCSGSDSTADRYIAGGLQRIEGKPSVQLLRPDREALRQDADEPSSPPYVDVEQLEIEINRIRGGWRIVHLEAIRQSDVVLAIGGSLKGTSTAIYTAETLGKPVALLSAFDGASKENWRDFEDKYPEEIRSKLQAHPDALDDWGNRVIKALEELKHLNPFKKTDTLSAIGRAVTVFLSFLTWILILFRVGSFPFGIPHALSVFALLISAAIAGTTSRSILRSVGSFRSRWRSASIFEELALGIVLSFFVLLVPSFAGSLMNSEPATLQDFSDVRRVGGALSVLCFLCSLFLEDAWNELRSFGSWRGTLSEN